VLTWSERLTLWNQYEILKKLDPDQVKEYEANQEILSCGYEQYYSELNASIVTETVNPSVSQEVQNILDVFRAIKFSCKKYKYTPKSTWAQFEGFDGNGDEGHYGFARFVRRTLGKWEELADRPDNSHSSASLGHYRAMVDVWNRLGRSFDLTPSQIEQIADAQ